jgi:diadenosine tetraphosphate (Ap4A) HIT family hydrolase
MTPCPFCPPLPSPPVAQHGSCLAIRDGFPVSLGHTLIVPRRHVASFFALDAAEQADLLALLNKVVAELDEEFAPDGYNIGFNEGTASGQTVMHVHLHVIPRRAGDTADPRGGVRWVLPRNADYWTKG